MNPEFSYGLAFLTGLAGGLHCLGMCGGFAAGYFAGHDCRSRWAAQLHYHGVRIGIYMLLGVLGALSGQVLVQVGMVGKMQGIVMMGSGLFILGIGIRYLCVRPVCPSASKTSQIQFGRNEKWGRTMPLLAGLLNGFVPCSLLFSVAVKSVAIADPLQAGALMLCFGLGTLPMMATITTSGAIAGHFSRGIWNRLTGGVILAFGAWTLYEGWYFYDIMRGLAG
ncbi:MAG: sulfite exporter TauE/SafE family protein [Gammaproteobacteria bacterium]|nr:sulfite exporter TauE/SafE family protein [Gammaproteobacteria bacterium]